MGGEGKQECEEGDGSGYGVNGEPTSPGWTNGDSNALGVVRNRVTMGCWTTYLVSIRHIVAVSPNSKATLNDSS